LLTFGSIFERFQPVSQDNHTFDSWRAYDQKLPDAKSAWPYGSVGCCPSAQWSDV